MGWCRGALNLSTTGAISSLNNEFDGLQIVRNGESYLKLKKKRNLLTGILIILGFPIFLFLMHFFIPFGSVYLPRPGVIRESFWIILNPLWPVVLYLPVIWISLRHSELKFLQKFGLFLLGFISGLSLSFWLDMALHLRIEP